MNQFAIFTFLCVPALLWTQIMAWIVRIDLEQSIKDVTPEE